MWRDDAPQLRGYQQAAVEWIAKRGSYGLFDEMRLGKTAVVLKDFCNLRATKTDARLLVVAPNNVIANWQSEVDKWTSLSCEVATGTARQRTAALTAKADVTVIAYDNIDRELAVLNENRFYSSVWDESHALKGPRTKRTKAAHQVRCVKRGLVTATPMLNRVDELWSQMFMIAPREFPSYWGWVNEYAVFGGYENRQIIGIQNASKLRAKMATHCLRRERKDVMADLPDPVPVDIYLDLNPVQRKFYDTALDELKIEIENKVVDEFENPLVRLLRLRQIIGTPACVGGPDDSALLDRAVEEIVGTASGRKIVVFTQFLGNIAAMRTRLDAVGVSYAAIQGEGMTAAQRADVIRRWSTSPDARVLLASYGVAREGIDLSAANLGIALDTLWVPALQLQAESRMVNVARKQIPEIVRLHGKRTVSTRVLALLREKQIAFDSVVGSDEFETKLAASLTLSEILR